MTKNMPKQTYITRGYQTTYMGESLKDAQELFTKARGSCQLLKLENGVQKLMQSKIKDGFPGVMKEAFDNATLRL